MTAHGGDGETPADMGGEQGRDLGMEKKQERKKDQIEK